MKNVIKKLSFLLLFMFVFNGTAFPQSIFFQEQFESGVPPAGWTVVDNEGNGVVWTTIAGSGEAGNYTNGSGEAACVSSDIWGPAEFDTELRTPVLDFTNLPVVTLSFTASYPNFAGLDFFDVDVSTDGGTSWTNIMSWNEDHGGMRATPGEDVSLNISALAGEQNNVVIRFHYYDPNIMAWGWYVQVDDLSITALPDADGDGVADCNDGCPHDPAKTDPGICGCGIADTDSDHDGTPDCTDAFPTNPGEWVDTDSDGTGNNTDSDDDNDGMPDDWEALHGLDPLADDAQGDADGDGYTNLEEYLSGTDPNSYNENLPPYPPQLSSPENGETGVSLTPTLETEGFSDADTTDTHLTTQWQVSTEADFSFVTLDITTASHLTSLTLPDSLLEEGTAYSWRVRFSDNHEAVSSWSDAFSFTTLTTTTDADSNGIPDDQEVDEITDLDDDGTPDTTEDDMKCVNTSVGDGQICTQISTNCTCIDCLSSVDPATIAETANRPESLPWGLISFRLEVENPGDTAQVIVYLSEPAPAEMSWYKYDAINGWQDYTDHASFSEERTTVTLTLTDGGLGDADGTANGIIVDPSGFGGGNIFPAASFTADPLSGVAPLTVTFDATSSHDPDGSIDVYSWEFGDGEISTGLTTTHEYPSWGIYTVTLTVTDDHGATDTATATITVQHDDRCPMVVSFSGSHFRPGLKPLREARDRILRRSRAGRAFVALYYRSCPTVSSLIAGHDTVQAAIRWGLLPVVGVSWVALKLGPSLSFLLAMLVVGSVLWLRKRRL